MKGEYINIFLHDEFPEIGTGNRRFIVWHGRKWVYLFYPARFITLRVTPKRYEELKPRKLTADEVNLDFVRDHLAKGLKSGLGSAAYGKQALTVLRDASCILPSKQALHFVAVSPNFTQQKLMRRKDAPTKHHSRRRNRAA